MKTRYRLTRRGIRGNKFYCVDTTTGKRTSLGTTNEDEARQIVEARNNSERQPVLNLQIAKAYLAGTDNGIATRTWQQAIESLASTKQGANQHRWQTAAKDKAFVPLMPRIIIETSGELLLKVMQTGKVSTNVFLRRLHNFCVDMNWLPWPLIPKRQWPAVRFKDKRAITFEEHQQIIAAEALFLAGLDQSVHVFFEFVVNRQMIPALFGTAGIPALCPFSSPAAMPSGRPDLRTCARVHKRYDLATLQPGRIAACGICRASRHAIRPTRIYLGAGLRYRAGTKKFP